MSTTILERLEEYARQDPLAPILFDEVYTKGIIEAIEIPGISSKENEKFRIFAGSYEAEDEDIEKWMDRL